MDDCTRKFIAHLPIPKRVSVKRAAEILDDNDAAQELLDLVTNGHLFSWTHCPASGDTHSHINHALGTHTNLRHVTADTDPANVFIEGREVQWRWCVSYESRLQFVDLPEKSTVEARERIVLEQARNAAAVTVEQPTETKEERQDRRLQACVNAGLLTSGNPARLPDGLGDVAAIEGVTRQAFSTDIKAALERRASAVKNGVRIHLI